MRHCVNRWRFIWALAFVAGIAGCDWSGSDTVGTELIHIPATASSVKPDTDALPSIAFQDTAVALGIVTEGTQSDVVYSFRNAGNAPLVLSDVSTSCGCTLAEQWPREPIAPGGTGEIAIRFDSRNRVGTNQKEIFVVTNAVPSTTTLHLTAEVIGPSTNDSSQ